MNNFDKKVFDLMNRVENKSHVDISSNYYFGDSKIHGTGTFASIDIPANEIVGNAFLYKDKKLSQTELGSNINHQFNSNSLLKKDKNGYNLYSTKDIKKGSEVTANYEEAPDFIDKNTKGFKENEYKF